jgi:hypothetical protein
VFPMCSASWRAREVGERFCHTGIGAMVLF